MKFKLPLWVIPTILNISISLIVFLISGDVNKFLTASALLSMIFLLLTLIPGNISNLLTNITLKKYASILISKRRDFGITFGITIFAHAIFAEYKYYNFDITKAFNPQILPGLLVLLVIIFLLITSNYTVQSKLRNWKVLHAITWFTIPLILVHGIFASIQYKGEFGIVNVLTIILFIFSFLKFIVGGVNGRKVRDIVYIILGVIVGIFFVMYNQVNQSTEDLTPSTNKSSITSSLLEQLKDHNTVSSCWVSFNGKVYDITSYLDNHPSGVSSILKNCGKDMSIYDSKHERKTGVAFDDPQVTEILKGLEKLPSL